MKYWTLLFFFCSLQALATADIEIVTENYPPYSYQQDGEIKGLSTEIVKAVVNQAKLTARITMLPWARAYSTTRQKTNTLIYSISRFPLRESEFKWVGKIVSINFSIFALKSRQDITPFNNLQQGKEWSVGTVRNDALEQYLLARGFTNLQRNNNHQSNMEKLLLGRIELWPISPIAARYLLQSHNKEPDQVIKSVHDIKGFSGGELYMAFGLKTDDTLVEQLRQALKEIKANGTYQSIIENYQK